MRLCHCRRFQAYYFYGFFAAGILVATPAALTMLEQVGIPPLDLINRHVSGDFGDLCQNDVEANLHAIETGLRILSKYAVGSDAVYVITEADRSSTCILLIEEY